MSGEIFLVAEGWRLGEKNLVIKTLSPTENIFSLYRLQMAAPNVLSSN